MTYQQQKIAKKKKNGDCICVFSVLSPAYSLNGFTEAFDSWWRKNMYIEDVQRCINIEICQIFPKLTFRKWRKLEIVLVYLTVLSYSLNGLSYSLNGFREVCFLLFCFFFFFFLFCFFFFLFLFFFLWSVVQ